MDTTSQFADNCKSITNNKLLASYYIESRKDDLDMISQKIWNHPELKFEEFFAHDLLTEFLQKNGFEVRPHWPLETSFVASYSKLEGPRIGVICEYDALPDIGHACGHNLIAESGVAAGLALKHVLEETEGLSGTVVVFGTPAEEGAGGKMIMIEKGAFDCVDVCMMVHPYTANLVDPICLSIEEIHISFHCRDNIFGSNSLDAAIMFYSSVSAMRQQFHLSWKTHGIIKKHNVVHTYAAPDETVLHYYMRASNDDEVEQLKKRILTCAESAANASGCQLTTEGLTPKRSSLLTNTTISKLFKHNAHLLGVDYMMLSEQSSLEGLQTFSASTDMGNVSHYLPSIHPTYSIPTLGPNHTREFARGSCATSAQEPTLAAAKALAMTGVDIFENKQFVAIIQAEFKESKIKKKY